MSISRCPKAVSSSPTRPTAPPSGLIGITLSGEVMAGPAAFGIDPERVKRGRSMIPVARHRVPLPV